MKSMKKYGIIALMLVAAAFSVFLPIYIWPKDVANEFDAVMYTEGFASEYTEVHVDISGHFNRRLFGGTRFIGKVKLEGTGLPEEYYTQNVNVRFDRDDIGVLKYFDESGEQLRLVDKGYISMPMDVSYVIISWGESEDINNHDISGSTIITGPVPDISAAENFVSDKLSKLMD